MKLDLRDAKEKSQYKKKKEQPKKTNAQDDGVFFLLFAVVPQV